jgi:hypothetical protein
MLLNRRLKVASVCRGSELIIPNDTSRHFALLQGLKSRVDFVQAVGAADKLIELELLGQI